MDSWSEYYLGRWLMSQDTKMLEYAAFNAAVVEELPELLRVDLPGKKVEFSEILGTNGIKRDTIIVKDKEDGRSSASAAPILYMDDIYREYLDRDMEISEILKTVKANLIIALEEMPDPKQIERMFALDSAFISLINLERNREYLKGIPHMVYGDLAAVCKMPVMTGERNGITTITYALMESHGWSKEQLFNAALDHTRDELLVSRMEDKMLEMFGGEKRDFAFDDLSALSELSEDGTNLFVITNREGFWGDGILLMKENLAKLSEMLDNSLVLIPSSVHEVIAVPDRGADFVHDCLSMLKDVNQSTVDPKEQLSDNVYRYDRDTGGLTCLYKDGGTESMILRSDAAAA